jgi:hypothetical protein
MRPDEGRPDEANSRRSSSTRAAVEHVRDLLALQPRDDFASRVRVHVGEEQHVVGLLQPVRRAADDDHHRDERGREAQALRHGERAAK